MEELALFKTNYVVRQRIKFIFYNKNIYTLLRAFLMEKII
jgi:hypothetical protein